MNRVRTLLLIVIAFYVGLVHAGSGSNIIVVDFKAMHERAIAREMWWRQKALNELRDGNPYKIVIDGGFKVSTDFSRKKEEVRRRVLMHYNVEEVDSGCIPSSVFYPHGKFEYYLVMRKELNRRLGDNFLDQVEKEVDLELKRRKIRDTAR